MRFFTARRLALAAVLPVLLSFTVIPGCSEESEGERCGDGTSLDQSDCGAGLICKEVESGIYRCCNPDHLTNSRCVTVIPPAGGAGGGAGAGGAGAGGASTGGASTGGASTGGEAGAAGEAGSGS